MLDYQPPRKRQHRTMLRVVIALWIVLSAIAAAYIWIAYLKRHDPNFWDI